MVEHVAPASRTLHGASSGRVRSNHAGCGVHRVSACRVRGASPGRVRNASASGGVHLAMPDVSASSVRISRANGTVHPWLRQ